MTYILIGVSIYWVLAALACLLSGGEYESEIGWQEVCFCAVFGGIIIPIAGLIRILRGKL